jgi:hypothetical protein
MKRVPVTDHVKSTITALRERVGGRRLWPIIDAHPDRPDGLHASTLTHVLSGRAETIDARHLEFLEQLLAAPDSILGLEGDGVPEDHASLCPALLGELKRLREASGIGAYRLAKMIAPDAPELNARILGLWLGGEVKSVAADQLALVLKTWRDAPALIPLTEDIRETLKFELSRCGNTPKTLCHVLGASLPDLKPALISRWMSGAVGTAREDLLHGVLSALQRLPTAPTPAARSKVLDKAERLDWTDERKCALLAECERTKTKPGDLLRLQAETKPANLTGQRISNWLNRPTKTVPKHHYEWLLQAYRQLPDAS